MECFSKLKRGIGLHLIEIMIVAIIIALIIIISIPNLLGNLEKARQTKDENNARVIGETIISKIAEGKIDDSFIGTTAYKLSANRPSGLRDIIKSEFNGNIPKPESVKYKSFESNSSYVIDISDLKVTVYCIDSSGDRHNLYEHGN